MESEDFPGICSQKLLPWYTFITNKKEPVGFKQTAE